MPHCCLNVNTYKGRRKGWSVGEEGGRRESMEWLWRRGRMSVLSFFDGVLVREELVERHGVQAKKEVLECFVDCHWRLSVLCVVAMWDWPTPWWMLSDLLVSELAWVSTCSLNNFSRLLLFIGCCSPCLFILISCSEWTNWYTRDSETTKMRKWEETTEVMQRFRQAACKNHLNLGPRKWRLQLATKGESLNCDPV